MDAGKQARSPIGLAPKYKPEDEEEERRDEEGVERRVSPDDARYS